MKTSLSGIGLIALAIVSTPAFASQIIFTTDTTIDSTNSSYDGHDIVVSNAVLTVDGWHDFESVRLMDGAVLTHTASSNGVPTQLSLGVAGNLEVDSTASINANGRGFSLGRGSGLGASTGSPLSGGGGGNGGYGGLSSSNAAGGAPNGFAFTPSVPGGCGGSGFGGFGGAGGGVIRLNIGSNFVMNGVVAVNGLNATNSRSGGGAGGSIWVTAQTVSGNGSFTANGGAGEPVHGGGGGGGRIALHATNFFTGTITAFGGNGWQRGGAGTVFFGTNVTTGFAVADNGGFVGANTLLDFTGSAHALEVRGRANVVLFATVQQNLSGLFVRSNSTITTVTTNNATLNLSVLGDAVIEQDATISMLGKGATSGPGMGSGTVVAGGSGHGGVGGTGYTGTTAGTGGLPYDSITTPTMPGVAGRMIGNFPGGAGGGAVRMSVTGNLQLDGRIVADATPASGNASGGASGGSVLLALGRFSGSGAVSANGSDGGVPYGGGGAGGRIAVVYSSNSFNGTLSAAGGNGARAGGAGTIYTKFSSASYADVRVDNNGLIGTNTPVNPSGVYNLAVLGGAVVDLALSQSLGHLTIGSNSTFLVWPSISPNLNITVAGNVIVEAGGRISGDGLGNSGGTGSGSGLTSPAGSTGGGHGGYGGRGAGFTNTASPGGNIYGSTVSPLSPGSSGGGTLQSGGAGGAALRMTVSGDFVLDGQISVNGLGPITNNAGGGSGGSLWLSLNRFTGSGTISADGGSGHLPNGGGGGGGRIAITWNSNSFTGNYSARGGNGFVPGGAGTIYLRPNQRSTPDLIFDNGGLMGTNSVLDVSSLFNLTIGAGASVTSTLASVSVSNLTIGANARWRVGSLNLTAGTANIAAGGGLMADGVSSSGPGSGPSGALGSAGGGHGGYGGHALGTAFGGNAYGSTTNPLLPGSPGGGQPLVPTASRGGGVLRVTVSGPTILNGQISANGSSGVTNNSGGGSGGSIWLDLNQLTGSGNISASGGSGHLPNGGGGGGGRIAVYYNSNSFTGTFSARGGNGFAPGGAGTVYLRSNGQFPNPQLLVDNGGLMGTNTVLDVTQLASLHIGPGANLTSAAVSFTIGDLTIASKATWRVASLNLLASSVSVAAGGSLIADGSSITGQGQGQPSSFGSSGAGHGGYGGRGAGTSGGGNVYGTIANPTLSGSPGGFLGGIGGAARGGGSLRISVSGPMILDGRISANGDNCVTNNGGGGSGGSVLLALNQFSGSGDISANGGSGHLPNGGGGGGGRIAITWNSNAFTGSYAAKGGSGFQGGGAGTIYFKPNNQPYPSVLADNGGLLGTNTVIDISNISNLTVTGSAQGIATSTLFLGNLNITTNSALLAGSREGTLTLNISGMGNVAEGGRISADGFSVSGAGAGASGTPGSGGGGHGGYGGRGFGTGLTGGSSLGGNASGSLADPIIGGGRGGGLNFGGGSGGGVVRITMIPRIGRFTLDGAISANGSGASTNGNGGGAGGSVYLMLEELVGKGSITANGGSGHLPYGGGGGGGRVSVSYSFLKGNYPTNGFTGSISAKGGAGFVHGGAGTIYVRTNFSNIASVFVDNGGVRGTNTLVSGGNSFDLFVQGGAVATSVGTPRDLLVRSNAWVAQTSNWSVARNATLDAGGGIDLDGLGNSTIGRGATFSDPKGGGGHGGYGALNPSSAGRAYDSALSPGQSGSPGGNGSGSEGLAPFGGGGGGATRLTVGNTLTLNGEISADGKNGEFNSGGGSGGSVWIQTMTLAGDGLITATGGDGNGPAGGGGGGRIAVYFQTNQFTGLLSAGGGAGGMFGGAGTIYLRDNLRGISSLALDNCGNWGAQTPLSSSIGLAPNLTVTGSAIAEMQGAIPILSNIVVSAGGEITSGPNDTNLFLSLFGNLTVTEDAGIITDAQGFARDTGPGYGGSFFNQGAGGSHGGWGGDSASGAFGGMIYGSATHPTERGSGGGSGSGYPPAGSEGGGAIRLVVAGTAELNGLISANGGTGWQDDAGGGSGGSIWLSARRFTGNGALTAIGGDGDFFGGGGGGGGRIAIYSPTNAFTGFISAIGGDGANFGWAGTIFNSGALSGLDVIAQTPAGIVSNVVSQVALEFSEPVNVASVSAGDVRIYTPNGLLPASNQTYLALEPTILRVNFNAQNVPGNYRIEVGPFIEGLLAPRMSQVYTGAFSITLPMISGTVTNVNGQPVAGVNLLPSDGLMGTTTDASGNYSLGVPPDWVGTITPVLGTNAFVPGQLSFTNVNASVAGANFLMVATISPTLSSSVSGDGLALSWGGIAGVTYQPEHSTNLVHWLPYGPPLPGTNGWMHLIVPTSADPLKFVRLRATN